MKIIMKESYMNLGEAGEIVDVRPGYARNFLIPQKLAVTATAGNLRRFEDQKKEIEARREKERDGSRKTMEALGKVTLLIKTKVSEDGKLFGSITNKHIEAELLSKGVRVDRRQIVLGAQIKRAGDYQVLVKLVGGMKALIPLSVQSDAAPKLVESTAPAAPAKKSEEKAEKPEA